MLNHIDEAANDRIMAISASSFAGNSKRSKARFENKLRALVRQAPNQLAAAHALADHVVQAQAEPTQKGVIIQFPFSQLIVLRDDTGLPFKTAELRGDKPPDDILGDRYLYFCQIINTLHVHFTFFT